MRSAAIRLLGGIGGAAIAFGGVLLCRSLSDDGAGPVLAIAGGLVALTLLAYILANVLAGDGPEFLRGAMIGMSAGANAGIWIVLGVVPLAIGTGVLVALSLSNTIANLGLYQGLVGWANWILPVSWLIVGLGLTFLVLSLLGTLFTAGQVEYFRVSRFFLDWATGTVFIKGGWIANLNTYDTAFNMGNFAFIDKGSSNDHASHEAGHTLNLAAFGSVFHLIGFVDEVILNNGAQAFSERLADSHANPTAPNIPMWI